MRCMTLTVLCCLAIGHCAGAMDEPPRTPRSQRDWLSGRLRNDMAENEKGMPGTFRMREYARAKAIVSPHANSTLQISDSDVGLLAEYYYRTRVRAEEDLRQFERQLAGLGQFQGQFPNPPQAGPADNELQAAQADRDTIFALGGRLADSIGAAKNLSELIYASLPGFCIREKQTLPPWYFDFDRKNGTFHYVGPVHNSVYAGSYADRINTYVNVRAPRRPSQWLDHVFAWHQGRHEHDSLISRSALGSDKGNTGEATGPSGKHFATGKNIGSGHERGPVVTPPIRRGPVLPPPVYRGPVVPPQIYRGSIVQTTNFRGSAIQITNPSGGATGIGATGKNGTNR